MMSYHSRQKSGQGPAESLSSIRRISAVEMQRQALEMRKTGADFEAIAQAVGYSNKTAAYRGVMRALKNLTREPADELRKMELERLDQLMLAVWARALAGDLKAIDRVLAIMERRSQYLGLDAPKRIDITDHIREMALGAGLDPDEAIQEAHRIINARSG